MWKVYIIKSQKIKKYYIGCTNNFKRRLLEHNNGHNQTTEKDRPWILVYSENFSNQKVAYAREKKIKSYKSGNAFKKLVK